MLMSPNFKEIVMAQEGDIVIKRSGVASELVIPAELKNEIFLDADISEGKIVFKEGDDVYILTDTFGLIHNDDDVEMNVLFVDGGMVVHLVEGVVILKGVNGEPYTVNSFGEIDYPNNRRKHYYVTHEQLFEQLSINVELRYWTGKKITPTYTNNLLFNILVRYKTDKNSKDQTPHFGMKPLALYEDLGLGVFTFFNYSQKDEYDSEEDGVTMVDELDKDTVYEDEAEDEYSEEDDDEFADAEDLENAF